MALKLGMLGMWHSHAEGVVREVAARPEEFQLVGFWDPEPDVVKDRSARWREKIPDLRVYATPDELLRAPLDGVVVEQRVHENLALARRALEAGYPVMLEKPAGTSLAQYRELHDLARRKHLHVQMIYLFRYMTATLELLRRARSGALGDVYHFRARLPKALSDYARFEEELKLYSGGIYFEMAGHVIDFMVRILGKPLRVTPFLGHHLRGKPGKFVDNALAVFEYEHAWGLIEVPQIEVAPASRRIEVFGTRGAAVIPHLGSGHLANPATQSIEVYEEGQPSWKSIELPAATLHVADLHEFAAVVERKRDPEYSLEHDMIVQEALLASSGMA